MNEMALIKLASQCAYQLEADTEEFIRTAAINYANQVLRLTHDDFIRQMQRENPELSVETENVEVDNCAHQVLLKLESMGLIKG